MKPTEAQRLEAQHATGNDQTRTTQGAFNDGWNAAIAALSSLPPATETGAGVKAVAEHMPWYPGAALAAPPTKQGQAEASGKVVQIHIPKLLDRKQSDALVDAVCRAITKHDIDFDTVKLVHPMADSTDGGSNG